MVEKTLEFEKYLRDVRNFSERTVYSYISDTEEFVLFFKEQNNKDSESISENDIKTYLAFLFKKNLSKNTISRKLSSLRAFISYLRTAGYMDIDPMITVSNPGYDEKLPDFFTCKEIEKILDFLKSAQKNNKQNILSIRNHTIIEVLYSTGMRISELCSIDLEHIKQGTKIENARIKVSGKGGRQRYVFLHTRALESLANYMEYRKLLLSDDNKETSALFLNKNGSRISRVGVWNMLRKVSLEAGIIRGSHPHMIRHSFATHLLDNGADIRSVQVLLGHETLATTQKYTHVTIDKMRKILNNHHPHGSN